MVHTVFIHEASPHGAAFIFKCITWAGGSFLPGLEVGGQDRFRGGDTSGGLSEPSVDSIKESQQSSKRGQPVCTDIFLPVE